ncbi:dihydropteroate synthase, partial [Thermodesulfobacteriota bacterium]
MNRWGETTSTIKWGRHVLPLGQKTCIMGVLNVTPDSFSDGGRFLNSSRAIEHGLAMERDGADIIDVGGESTRPYSNKISVQEELDRVLPVIQSLNKELSIPISIDTHKAEVARQALQEGAAMINDISALRLDPEMASLAAKAEVPVVVMHMKGTPADMQDNPRYDNLLQEVIEFLHGVVENAVKAGIKRELMIVDPGIGFGKTFNHNLEIIKELAQLRVIERPILLGTSRKAFIGHILEKEANDRDVGLL